MKTINVTFTDAEYRKLLKAKAAYNKHTTASWHQFILNKCSNGHSVHKELRK